MPVRSQPEQPFTWGEQSTFRLRVTDKYEPIQPWIFLGCIDVLRATSVLDIGANIGFYSLTSTLGESVRQVTGFEAAPAAADEFRANVDANGLNDVVAVEEIAVSDENGEAEFLISDGTSGINALASTTMHRRAKYSDEPITVKTVTLDSWYAENGLPPGPIGMKVDVEGSEGAVFRGAEKFLSSRELFIQAEMFEAQRERDAAVLLDSGFQRLLRCDNDWYWTNSSELADRWLDVVELAMTNCVRAHKKLWPPLSVPGESSPP